MVSALFKSLNARISGIHRAAYVLAGFTLASQLLALFRDRLLAGAFGASTELDVYYAAFRVPDLVFVSVASLVSVSVIVPFLSQKIERGTEKDIVRFVHSITTLFIVLISVVSVVLFFVFPYLQPVLFPGFDEAATQELITLSRILLLSPILLGLSNIFGGINQTFKRFFVYALSPVLYNFGIILGIIFFSQSYGIQGVVWGVVLGATLHFLLQIMFVAQGGMLAHFRPHIDRVETMRLMRHSVPRTIALGSTHVALLVLVAIASTLEEGSISVFNFAFNLQSVPMSIIGVSYSLAAFPTLSQLYASGKIEEYTANIVTALRHIVFWSLPVIGLFVVLRAQIVRVILGTGAFDWPATRLTAAALAFFVLSVVFQNITLLLVRGYYAAGKTSVPLIINVSSAFVIIIMSFVLLGLFEYVPTFAYFIESLFRVTDVPGTKVLMLPLAFAIGVFTNCVILVTFFVRHFAVDSKEVGNVFYHSFAAAVVAGLAAYLSTLVLDDFFSLNTFTGIFLQGALSGIVALIVGWFLLKVLDNRELAEIEEALKKKYSKLTSVVYTDKDLL